MASRHHRRQILAWSIVIALGAAVVAPVLAQDTQTANTTGTLTNAADAAKNPDGTPKVVKLSEIKVTAQKRAEYLQDVPVTMVSLNKQQLQAAGVRDIKDLQILVPDLSVTTTDAAENTTARIRGIGTVGDNAGLESSVGIVIDGVPRARVGVGFGDLGELDQVDVLKGPQGTVFGKNTTAGVLDITTQRPVFSEQGYADFTVGNYNAVGFDAAYNNKITTMCSSTTGRVPKRRTTTRISIPSVASCCSRRAAMST
jgi:iron complex outermembrane receptor protein